MSDQQFTAIQNELNDIDAIINSFRNYQLTERRDVREDLNTYIGDLRSQLQNTTDRLGVAQARTDELEAEKQSLKRTIVSQMQRVDELSEELAMARQSSSTTTQSNREVDELRLERDTLRKELNTKIVNYAKVERKLVEYKQHIDELQAQIEGFDTVVPRSTAKYRRVSSSRASSEDENDSDEDEEIETEKPGVMRSIMDYLTPKAPTPVVQPEEPPKAGPPPPLLSPEKADLSVKAGEIMALIDEWRDGQIESKEALIKKIKPYNKPYIEEVVESIGVPFNGGTKDQLLNALKNFLRK